MAFNKIVEGLILSDNFTRANSDSLGGSWIERAGDWDIFTNQMRKVAGAGTHWVENNVDSIGESFVQSSLRVSSTAVTVSMLPRFDWNGGSPNGYAVFLLSTGLGLRRLSAGTFTTIGSDEAGSPSANTYYQFQLYVADGLQEAWREGGYTTEANDTTHDAQNSRTLGFRAGFGASGTVTADVDLVIWCRSKYITVTGLTPGSGQKVKVLNSGLSVVAEATESGGTAVIDCSRYQEIQSAGTGATEGVPAAGWAQLIVTDSSDVTIEALVDPIYPGQQFVWEEEGVPTRVTQFGIEVLYTESPPIRTTQLGVEVLFQTPAPTGITHDLIESVIQDEDSDAIVTQDLAEVGIQQEIPLTSITHDLIEFGIQEILPDVFVTHSLIEYVLKRCPPLEVLPSNAEYEFISGTTEQIDVINYGTEPPPGIEVRYQLYIEGQLDTVIQDSGWITWTNQGYRFLNITPEVVYILRYGFRDACPAQAWTYVAVTGRRIVNELIVSQLELHTQKRSPRVTGRVSNRTPWVPAIPLPAPTPIPTPEPEPTPDYDYEDQYVPDEYVPDEYIPDEYVPDEYVPDEYIPDEYNEYEEVIFESLWETALGTGDAAVMDTGSYGWDASACMSRPTVLEVIEGDSVGWTLTPNVLRVHNDGEESCGMIENSTAIPSDADNYFVRAYGRVSNVSDNGFTFHSFNMAILSPIQGIYWALNPVVTDVSFKPRLSFSEHSMSSTFLHLGPTLNQNEWYRYEWHVEYYDPGNPLRCRIWPYIYNMAGDLIADANDYISAENAQTLAANYAAGEYGLVDSRDRGRYICLGYEGTATNDDEANWYWAALKVTLNTFPVPL